MDKRTSENIGSALPRPDGWEKVTGRAQFIDDMNFPGMWFGKTIRSSVPCGIITKVEMDPAFDWSTVTVMEAKDLPGPNEVSMVENDMPILAEEQIRYCGEPVILIAAPDKDLLESASRAITISIIETTPLLSMEESLKGKPLIYGKDNTFADYTILDGEPDKTFEKADLVVEGTYHTGYQEQLYLEPQGMIALPTDDGIEIIGSMQCPYYIHRAASHALSVDPENIVIKQTVTGGAFGGKEDYPSVIAIHTALLALESRHPVKMIYDREEDLLVTPKRHPSLIRHRTGVRNDGTIVASDIDLLIDGGAYSTLSKVVLQRAILHAAGPYRIPDIRMRGRALATNKPPSSAFRGFGVPQSCFAVERHMDRIAAELGMEPLELRRKNLLQNGNRFPFGQEFTEGKSLDLVLEKAVELSDYKKKRGFYRTTSDPSKKRGIGLSLYFHGGGFTGSGEEKIDGKVRVQYSGEDLIEILVSSVEMGQGASAMFISIAAETMELPHNMFRHPHPDTSRVPDSGPTVASRTTMFVGRIVMDACLKLLETLKITVSKWYGLKARDICYSEGIFSAGGTTLGPFNEMAQRYVREEGLLSGYARYVPPQGMLWDDESFSGSAYKSYSWGADVAEVEVDMNTYEIKPLKITAVVEIGKIINAVTALGQVEGGTLQALGYGYLEEMKTIEGRFESGHMTHYHIPTSMDCPEYQVSIQEIPYAEGPFGAKGLGELPMDGGAPALVSAIENATGLSPARIPVTGERLEELNRRAKSDKVRDDK